MRELVGTEVALNDRVANGVELELCADLEHLAELARGHRNVHLVAAEEAQETNVADELWELGDALSLEIVFETRAQGFTIEGIHT